MNQTVLLRGVNDSAETLETLCSEDWSERAFGPITYYKWTRSAEPGTCGRRFGGGSS